MNLFKNIFEFALIAIVLSPRVVISGENVIHLECNQIFRGAVQKGVDFVAIIELDKKKLMFGRGGHEDEYTIDIISETKITATQLEGIVCDDGLILHNKLEINRITGKWLMKMPTCKSDNKNIWNEEEQKMGYPKDMFLVFDSGGLCKSTKPIF